MSEGNNVRMEILLVEDNPADVGLTKEGLRESTVATNLHVVTDGRDALDFLSRTGKYSAAPRPDLVLLDLNLPSRGGLGVLADIKQAPELRSIPVVIVTSSYAETDIQAAYDLHANCYLTKPADLEKYFELIHQLAFFWFVVVKRPRRKASG